MRPLSNMSAVDMTSLSYKQESAAQAKPINWGLEGPFSLRDLDNIVCLVDIVLKRSTPKSGYEIVYCCPAFGLPSSRLAETAVPGRMYHNPCGHERGATKIPNLLLAFFCACPLAWGKEND